jgi:hypothetical protein
MIRIDGLTPDEILSLPSEELDELVFVGRPLVFRVGSAEILGEFQIVAETLILDLAHIDGGGEGVLPVIAAMAQRLARARGLSAVEWLVRATRCARPNPKLRRVLERRGFVVRDLPQRGECYFRCVQVLPEVRAEMG